MGCPVLDCWTQKLERDQILHSQYEPELLSSVNEQKQYKEVSTGSQNTRLLTGKAQIIPPLFSLLRMIV